MLTRIKILIEERKELESELRDTNRAIKSIQDACKHIVKRNRYELYDPKTHEKTGKTTIGDGVEHCPKCDYDFGFPAWWCPKSKSHLCDYSGQDNYHLVCKFCGAPEERK